MKDKLQVLRRTRFKKTNFNAFFFFLLLAVVIWIFAQFSKVYDEIIEIPVEYVNAPPDKFLTEDNPQELKLRMVATGFRLSFFNLFPPTLELDISKTKEQEGDLVYIIDEHRNAIQSQLGISFEESQFVNRVVRIKYQQRKKKTIPVYPQIQVAYAVGYAATAEIDFEPDSVTVSGPDNILDTLNQLHTVGLNLKEVNQDLSGKIAIDTSLLSQVSLYTNSIDYQINVGKFTEGRVEIPIDLINVPQDLNVVIFPKKILLFYQVNLQEYSSIIPADFRVVCDFGEREEGQGFLIPKIVKQPEKVTNLRLNEKKIQFIIKK